MGRKYFFDIVNLLDLSNLCLFISYSYATFSSKDWAFAVDALNKIPLKNVNIGLDKVKLKTNT